MTHAANLGVYVPGKFQIGASPWNPISRGMGDFVSADRSAFLTRLEPTRGMGCYSCNRGMGALNFSQDFTDMMNGTASWQTYAIYGGGALAAVLLVTSFMGGSGGGGRRRR